MSEQGRILNGNTGLCRQHGHNFFVGGAEGAFLLIDGLQHTHDGTIERLDGHAQNGSSTVSRCFIGTVKERKWKERVMKQKPSVKR
jgi:hypothetical protein